MSQLDPTFHSAPSSPDTPLRARYLARGVDVVDPSILGLPAVNDPVVQDASSTASEPEKDSDDVAGSANGAQEHTLLCDSEHPQESPAFHSGSTVNSLEFLTCVGKTLYASAQRGHITLAVAAISVADEVRGEEFDVTKMVKCCQTNLRETDVFAQSAENEFIVIVTNVGKHNITGIFERLSDSVSTELSIKKADTLLEIGATVDLGITFESMIHRARAELYKSKNNSSK